MELDKNFSRSQEVVPRRLMCKFTPLRKKAKGNKGEAIPADSESLTLAKAEYDKAAQAVAAAKLAITMEGVKAFELYGNLLSDKARPAWKKIIKAQMTTTPWEDIKGVTHNETPTKTWDWTPSWSVSCSTFNRCLKLMQGGPSSTTS